MGYSEQMVQKVIDVTPEVIVNMPQDNPKAMWYALLTAIVTTVIAPVVTLLIRKRMKDNG